MKKVVISILGFMISILVASNVLAATSLTANVSSSVKDVKAGQEVVLKLKLDQYQEVEKGINAYKATLDYNKEVFEQVKQENLVTLNGWEQLEYHPETEELVAIKRAGSKAPEEVLMITLKVKQNAKPQETEIKIKDIVTSEGKEDIFVPETSIKVNIIKEQTETPVAPVNPAQPDNNSNLNQSGKLPNSQGITGTTSNNSSNGGDGESQDDGTTATKTFPKTGNKQRKIALMIALAVEILLIIAYVSKRKGKEIDLEINRRTKAMVATLVVSIVSLQAMGSIYAAVYNFVSKGELNDDGEINYADVNLLELHLIHKQDLPENKLENADMNNDEQLTVTDLTLLIQKIERTLDYQVQLSDVELENYYPNQNQDITLKFDGSVSYDANIKKAVINGQEYEVQKVEGTTNEYTFKTNTGNVAGIKEYQFTEVLLDNEKRVKVDYTLKIDVLKEKPTIENYTIEEDINEQKIKLFFDLVDKDDSITSAEIEIFNEAEEVIQEETIVKGQNQIEVAVEEGKKYRVNFVLSYDLDSNEIEPEEDHTGMEQIMKELQMVIDYNLKITNITTKKDDQATTTFEKNEPIQLAFESTNSTIHEPTTIKVNGKEYVVTKKENQYIATIDSITELGEKEIVIEEVVLGNGKKFTLENDNKVTINVIKQKPTATDLASEESIENNNIKISFTLKDEDKTVKNATVILLDAEGNEIERQELSDEEIENAGKIEKTLTTTITSSYKIKVIATYNQTGVETEEVLDSVLLEQEIKAEPRATIKQAICDKEYVEKGETVTITYDIETNKLEDISEICVSNTDCKVTKLADGKYEVTLTVSEENGIQELTATKVRYSDNTTADVDQTIKVDVLKDKPRIENYKQEDNIENSQVTLNFDFIDEDNSVIEGKAVLTKQEDPTVKEEKEIQVGKNSITFDVENAKLYTLEIKATYDRDTNTLEGKPEEDNRVTEEALETKEIQLLSDYELQISNIKTYKGTVESKYFEKEEAITLKFESTNISKFVPVKAVINGKEYSLTKTENTYETVIDTYSEAGAKDIVIEKVILDNTKELEVTEDHQTKIEILKDKPTATKFSYTEEDDNTIIVTFQINDEEQTITNGNIVITDESGKTVKTQEITEGSNTVTFEKTGSESYIAKITANYDLDTNSIETGKNEVQDGILLEEEINVGDRLIEMKDIETITLYKQTQNNVSEVTSLSTADLANLQPYIVKVQMKDMPEFYSTIREYKIEDGNLKFVLDYDHVIQYEGEQKRNTLEVTYGAMGDKVAENQSLEELIEQIKANPSGDFVLMKDFDASNIGSTTTLVDASVTFTGTLNGNGHKITNLSKPLFNACNGATIENLVIENARMTAYGAITPSMNATTIRNVHLVNPYVASPGSNGTGTFAGIVTGNSLIENCSATNVTVGNAKRTGGMVGKITDTTIRNCYITGRVNAGSDGSGGLVGEGFGATTIENCYVAITTNFSWTSGSIGGIIGNPENTTLKNSLSLAQSVSGDGHGYRVKGKYQREINGASSNNYELATSNLISNASHAAISEVEQETVETKEFYTEVLGWSNEIWDLDNVGDGRYPTLRGADPNYSENIEEQPTNDNIYIPDYSRLKKLSNYKQEKEIAYSNLYQIMPFYDAKYLLVDGSKIAEDDILNTKLIKHILPYDKDKKLITTLTQNDNQKIASIKIIFEDDTTKDYTLTFDEYKGYVASYKIEELGIRYNYNRYVLKQDATIVNTLAQYIQNLDYTTDLDPLTAEEDSRLYRDHFNQTVKTNALEFILKLIEHGENIIVTTENSVLNQKIENDFITSGKLKQMVYAYNYYKRWYNIDVTGTEVTDIILTNGKLFNDSMTFDKMLDEVIASNSNRSTNATQTFYASNIAKYTGKTDIGLFLDYIINIMGEYEDVNDWFTENYQGIVYEIPAENHPDVEYRAWRQLKRRNNFLLPFMTLPKDSAFIVSSATQFLVGAQRVYISDPSDPTQKEQLINKIKTYSVEISNFYTTTAGFVEASRLNAYTDIQVDRRTTTDGVYQVAGTTEEPFHKNFCEAVGYWAAANGAAAYATGSNVYWVVYRALDSFGTWSHESGHNQDSKIFLKGYGRRGAAEDYADGNITQGAGDGGENFNLAYNYDMDATTSVNLTTERINTTEKLDSYFKGMFQAIDFLDYVEAKAFLKLTPEEQSKIALQVFYPAEEAEGYSGTPDSNTYLSTGWRYLTAEQFKKMNLQTVEDLWDNRIMIRPGTADGKVEGAGRYGYESMYVRHWYQPHNDLGRPYSYGFKHLAWEMLGFAGYENGYVKYFSGYSKNDLDAIQKITGDETMTWKKYKMNRYADMQTKWNLLQDLDSDELLLQYVNALKTDAQNGDINVTASTNVRRLNYHHLKRVTNDFRTEVFTSRNDVIHIKTAEEFRTLITEKPYGQFVLDNDIDVSSITDGDGIVTVPFFGRLDGNGHKITGNTLPIFYKLHYAYITNLKIEGTRINGTGAYFGALTKVAANCNITNVTGKDIQVTGTGNEIGGILGNTSASYIKNVHTTETIVKGAGRVGVLVGYGNQMTIEECSSNGDVIATGNAVGGFFGQCDNSTVKNSYSIGNTKGSQDVGGFIGWSEGTTAITNCYSNSNVVANSNSGGFIGQLKNTSYVQNSIAFGNVTNAYKFDGRSASTMFGDNYKNNYEFEEAKGISTLVRTGIDFTGKISVATNSEVTNTSLYTGNLGWNVSIWDFTNVAKGGLPKLRNDDPNNIESIIEKIEISTVEDFVKIEEQPDANYSITKDIDFSSYTGESPIISTTFTGRIYGENHTISNLNNTILFANFNGIVKDLNIKDVTNTTGEDTVTAFAKTSNAATFKNMTFENITLNGTHRVATVVGTDQSNSTFEQITVKNANITGSGVYIAGLVGRKYGGSIKNCYVQGSIECYTTECGGIVGASQSGGQIENVVANVNINRPRSTDNRNNNGGFIGNIYNAPSIKNSISIGNMTGFTDASTGNEINVYKFAGCTEENITNYFTNCYELKTATGTSSVTANTGDSLKEATLQNLKDKNFYKNILGFDETVWNLDRVVANGYPELR